MEQKIFNEKLKLTASFINSLSVGALAWAMLRPFFIEGAEPSMIGAGVAAIIHLGARAFLQLLRSEP